MSKPALYWTIHVGGWLSFEVIAVTSEKRTQVFGRGRDGVGTHRLRHECRGRFDTEELAQSLVSCIREIQREYSERRKPVSSQLSALYAQERDAINSQIVLRGGSPL